MGTVGTGGLLSPGMFLLSASATLRTVAVLLILWLVLRWYLRSQAKSTRSKGQVTPRPKGDVRIENAPRQGGRDQGIIDAEFEEIK